jgi:two-component system response regulator AlgR
MSDPASPLPTHPLRVLVVDDEAPARERLRRMLAELDGVEVAGEAADGHEALACCAALSPDLVLLDIHMPGMDGIEVARHLATLESPPAVIFTTAYDEYAVEAFEMQAVGYLMKPVRQEKLARAVHHAARLATPQLVKLAERARLGRRRSQICTRLGDQLKLVPVPDILYFAADQKYVTIRHRGGRDLIDEPLRALEDEFAPDFVRIHRNSLVALQHVRAVERNAEGHYMVRFKEFDETLPMSRRHAPEALRRIRGRE